MATCAVSGMLKDITETAIQGAVIKARIVTPFFNTTIQIAPREVSTTSSATGLWTLNLSQSSTLIVTIEYPPNTTDSRKKYTYSITVPATSTADFSTLATES